ENSELKIKIVKLSCDFEEIRSKGVIIDFPEQLPISEKKMVSVSTEMKNFNDTPEQIDLQIEDVLTSDISDNTSNSDVSLPLIDNTSEQIVSRNEESNTSSHSVFASSNSDIYQDSVTLTSPIPSETISLEEKEENEFLDSMYKEQVSKEIMKRIREKKLQDQEALSTPETNTPDISHEQSLIQEKCQEISVTKQITEHQLSQVTTQRLVRLFQNAIRVRHEEILSWYHYSDNFENKVIEICCETGVTDKTARTQLYKEMLNHLPGITSGNLRMKILRVKKIRMLFGKDGVGIEKIKQVTYN
ncbi:1974_t:CDS:2, partial [Diversispora eburnea]